MRKPQQTNKLKSEDVTVKNVSIFGEVMFGSIPLSLQGSYIVRTCTSLNEKEDETKEERESDYKSTIICDDSIDIHHSFVTQYV